MHPFDQAPFARREDSRFGNKFVRCANEYPGDELASLYCSRWRIETAFKEMKIWHGLENLRAHSARGIYQEITGGAVWA